MKKRIFSLALASTMILGSFGSVMADDVKELEIKTNKPFVDGYPGGTFKPDKDVTRAEVTKLITLAYDYATQKSDFPDTKEHWATDYIGALKGELKGFPDGKFYPDDNITRAEFVTILSRVSGEDISEYYDVNIFDDISNNTIWYKGNANWAYINGVAVGYNGRFDGDRNITREEMSKMVMNYIKSYDVDISKSNYQKYFHDENEIASWAHESVMFLADHEILNGMGDGRFAPKENTSRAQAAQIIYNFIRFH